MSHTFGELNLRASQLGAQIMGNIIEANDLDSLRIIRTLALELYDKVIELADSKPDYPTWYAALMQLNRETPYHQLDATGEFTRIVDDLEKADATGYYFENVLPLMVKGSDQFKIERAIVAETLDGLVNKMISQRRETLRVVQ